MFRATVGVFIAAVVLAGCYEGTEPLPQDAVAEARFSPSVATAGASIPGHYIVVFRSGVRDVGALARELAAAGGSAPRYVYQAALKGFAAPLSAEAAAALARHPDVLRVEQDQVAQAFGTQTNPTWGLDRVDQRALPLSGAYNYTYTGAGVSAYIIDTGIRLDHGDFGGRALSGYDAIDGGSADDCNGHGTHVAGTVGGTAYGVAKGVKLVAVRVLDCRGSGTYSGVIAGVDWVTANHVKPAVANMSLGGGASSTLDGAVRNSIAAGVTYVVAAGNDGQDACNYSPARVAEAMTMGASNSSDVRASWSNWGSCVDWFAPGVSITSAWHTSSTATNTISGTSMASPHTAGAAALYLEHYPAAAPQTVRDSLYAFTTKNVIGSAQTTDNHLLYSLEGAAAVNAAPSASFTYQCSELACSFTDTSTDGDGSIAGWSWNFGDGSGSTAQNPSHTYAAGGSYTVTLTVTDDAGATSSASQTLTVSASTAPGGGMSLSAAGSKVKGFQVVDLTWSGAGSTNVDVQRKQYDNHGNLLGSQTFTTANDGAHRDELNVKGGGMSYVYKLCETGTTTCSNEAKVVF